MRFAQESDFRQLRDFGQKFSASFEFIGAHWRGLGQAMLYLVLPAAILQGIAKRVEAGTASSAQAVSSAAGARPLAQMAWKFACAA